MVMTSSGFVVGVDVGQVNDHTAVVVLQFEHGPEPVYHLGHAQRFQLGTDYLEIVERIAARLIAQPLDGRAMVAIDATGVGKPIVDLIRPQLPPGTYFYPIWITGGISVGRERGKLTVPKRDLITTTQLLLQNGRLRIANEIPDASALVEELLSYRVTISDAGHDSYGPWREQAHDDLVLALAIAAWTAENKRSRGVGTTSVPRGQLPILSSRTLEGMLPWSLPPGGW
jgi:hypothetical protein